MNKESKRIALTTKTLCGIKAKRKKSYRFEKLCPCVSFGEDNIMNRSVCNLEDEPVTLMCTPYPSTPKRSKKCKERFPGVIVMTSLKG